MTDLTPATLGLLHRLARRVGVLEQQTRDLGRASQARDRAVEGGAQSLYDEDDELRAVVGEQDDGTWTITTYGGPTPPAPAQPLIAQVAGGATITWDGFDVNDESAWPSNMLGVKVHLSTLSGDPATADTFIGTIGGAEGGALTIAQPYDVTTYCTLVAVTTSGVESVQSMESEVTGGAVEAVVTRTTSTDEAPASAAGYAEGHQWWQIVDSQLKGVWEVIDGAWAPVELVTGQVGYFQQALIEALQVTGLTAVVFEGGSIYIAGSGGLAHPQAFSGTALPAGWTAVETPTGAWVAPVPSVISSGYPSGGVGSVLRLSSGAAGQAPGGGGASLSTVTADFPVNDFELVMRYRTTVNNDGDLFPRSEASLDFNKTGGTYHRLNLGHTRVGLTIGGQSIAVNVGTPTGSQWVNVRLRKAAGSIVLTAWRDGQPEPSPKALTPSSSLADGALELRLYASSIFGASDGQILYVDQFDVTELATGFRVNPDGTGEWPAIGLRAGDAAWSTVGASGKPAYQNGWTGQSGDLVAYRRSPTGDVTIVGRAVPGSANVAIFTLPIGYRPSRDLTDLITKAQGTGVFSTLDILANGQVIARGTGSATWVSLTMTFPTT